jgi:hypothetical protein
LTHDQAVSKEESTHMKRHDDEMMHAMFYMFASVRAGKMKTEI